MDAIDAGRAASHRKDAGVASQRLKPRPVEQRTIASVVKSAGPRLVEDGPDHRRDRFAPFGTLGSSLK
jgi:hypothetical protein